MAVGQRQANVRMLCLSAVLKLPGSATWAVMNEGGAVRSLYSKVMCWLHIGWPGVCREKETLKAMAAQERQAMRLRDRAEKGVKDDLDIEWAALVEQRREAG